MNTKLKITLMTLITATTCLPFVGCSSMPGQPDTKDIASNGPTIINAKTSPSTIQLNRSMQPTETPEVTADVKDFNHRIADVKLKFVHVPVEVPMENMGGTTWRGLLSPEQLQMLAVTGKTVQYDANVVASNDRGQTAMTQNPITISIKAPEIPAPPSPASS